MARDDAVARNQLLGHAEIAATVHDKLVDFFEAAGIERQRLTFGSDLHLLHTSGNAR